MIIIHKICCFIGHREIENEIEIERILRILIEDLIVNNGVDTFLFGSRSDFNYLCLSIVTELKKKYPHIKRVGYSCRSECYYLESEREKWEKYYSEKQNKEVHLYCVDEEYDHKTKYTAGKASYVERNKAMIDDSDLCVVYYKEDYLPEKRKYSKRHLTYYQPKSGTRLAFEYIKQRRKDYVNVAEIISKW